MQTKSRSIYSCARTSAGYTQEQAAELLNLGVRTLADYELGQRRPPTQTVEQMAVLYRAPGLRLEHARDADELGVIPRGTVPRSIEQVALRMGVKHRAAPRYLHRLQEIAEDGRVAPDEAEDFADIQRFVAAFVADCLALGACEGIKKERPDVGASKRSSPTEKPENYSKDSVSAFSADCKSKFRRSGGADE